MMTLIVLSAFFFGAALAVYACITETQKRHWPRHEGKVTEFHVERYTSLFGSEVVRSIRLRYSYSVYGNSHEGEYSRFRRKNKSLSKHLRWLEETFSPNGTCDVYVNPKDPKQSCLLRPSLSSISLIFIVAIVMMTVVLMNLYQA